MPPTPSHPSFSTRCLLVVAWGLVLLIRAGWAWAQPEAEATDYRIVVGEQIKLPYPPGARLINSNPNAITTKFVGDGFFVAGKAQGFGVVTIGEQEYSFTVVESGDLKDMLEATVDLLKGVEGVEVRLAGGRLIVNGDLLSPGDLEYVEDVANAFGAICLARLDPTDHFPAPIIRLTFHFAEVNHDLLQDIGIAWGRGVIATVLDGFTLGNGIYNLFSTGPGSWSLGPVGPEIDNGLEVREDSNLVRIHDVHEVTVLNGEKDTYHYGGTLLIPVASGLATSVEKVEFGTSFEVTPLLDRQGRILLNIAYEVSDVVQARATGTYELSKRSQATTLLVDDGEIVALAGAIHLLDGAAHTGLPWLSRVPGIGVLFGRKTWADEQTDGVVFITAETWAPAPIPERNRRKQVIEDLRSYPWEVAPLTRSEELDP